MGGRDQVAFAVTFTLVVGALADINASLSWICAGNSSNGEHGNNDAYL